MLFLVTWVNLNTIIRLPFFNPPCAPLFTDNVRCVVRRLSRGISCQAPWYRCRAHGNREPHFWCPGASFPESNLLPSILTTPLTSTDAGAYNCIIRKHQNRDTRLRRWGAHHRCKWSCAVAPFRAPGEGVHLSPDCTFSFCSRGCR
jgi:hypothetical protein